MKELVPVIKSIDRKWLVASLKSLRCVICSASGPGPAAVIGKESHSLCEGCGYVTVLRMKLFGNPFLGSYRKDLYFSDNGFRLSEQHRDFIRREIAARASIGKLKHDIEWYCLG